MQLAELWFVSRMASLSVSLADTQRCNFSPIFVGDTTDRLILEPALTSRLASSSLRPAPVSQNGCQVRSFPPLDYQTLFPYGSDCVLALDCLQWCRKSSVAWCQLSNNVIIQSHWLFNNHHILIHLTTPWQCRNILPSLPISLILNRLINSWFTLIPSRFVKATLNNVLYSTDVHNSIVNGKTEVNRNILYFHNI